MNEKELFKGLNGIMAYDLGSIDSGIHDELLRKKIIDYLERLSEDDFRIIITKFIREFFVSEKAVSKGYGVEDVRVFIDWLSEMMKIDI